MVEAVVPVTGEGVRRTGPVEKKNRTVRRCGWERLRTALRSYNLVGEMKNRAGGVVVLRSCDNKRATQRCQAKEMDWLD
jgi:hypothetical protein